MTILVAGRNAEIEELNNTIASLQNKCLTEEITRINLTNRSLEAMKTNQPCDQLTTEVTQMSNNNTEAIKHSILNSQINQRARGGLHRRQITKAIKQKITIFRLGKQKK